MTTPYTLLNDFLTEHFSGEGLHDVLRHFPHGEQLVKSLPSPAFVSDRAYAAEVVSMLRRRDRIDARFFATIAENLRNRGALSKDVSDRLADTATSWGVETTTRPPLPPPRGPGTPPTGRTERLYAKVSPRALAALDSHREALKAQGVAAFARSRGAVLERLICEAFVLTEGEGR